jgi:hypothetical protein
LKSQDVVTDMAFVDPISENAKIVFFLALGILLSAAAFLFNSPLEIAQGNLKILVSTANLVTDYMELANVGSALMNVGIMILLSIWMVKVSHAQITGSIAAALFTMAGFSFFGKNLFNSLPILTGVFLYAKAVRTPFARLLPQALFGTALAPLVSEIAFGIGPPSAVSVILGVAAGGFAGFILPPLSAHFLGFHQGFNLYNVGFTAGIIGMFFLSVLRGFGIEVVMESVLSSGHNLEFSILLYALFAVMLLCGCAGNRWKISGLRAILSQSGKLPSDFIAIAGAGPALINMASLGILSTSYVLVVSGELSGPVIGGILTVAGFGAYGKHLRNVIPVMSGVFLASQFYVFDTHSTVALLGALFGTSLAPIAGFYGAGYGVIAGALHMAVVSNIGILHGGMNLYNNGFSCGFIAAALVPLIEAVRYIHKPRK